MFLPIRLFLDYTDVSWEWEQSLELLHISDERVVKGDLFENFKVNSEEYLGEIKNEDAYHKLG